MSSFKKTFNHTALVPWMLSLSLLFSLYSCNKEEPLAPDICKEEIPCLEDPDNDHFVAAYLNGELWESRNDSWDPSLREIDATYNTNFGGLDIVGSRITEIEHDYLSFGAITNGETGVFDSSFGQSSNYRNFRSHCVDGSEGASSIYEFDNTFDPKIKITEFDMNTRMVAGYFNYQVQNISPNCDHVVTIEQGRFRCHFNVFP